MKSPHIDVVTAAATPMLEAVRRAITGCESQLRTLRSLETQLQLILADEQVEEGQTVEAKDDGLISAMRAVDKETTTLRAVAKKETGT